MDGLVATHKSRRSDFNMINPAAGVFQLAVLQTGDRVVKLLRHGSDFSTVDMIALASVHELAYGRNHS